MRLYYARHACSRSALIVSEEAELDLSLERVSLKTRTLEDGSDFREISPQAKVPALALENGVVLTEAPAVLVYLAERRPETGLLPGLEDLDRYRVLQWLAFVASELHKRIYAMLFWEDEHHAQAARQAAPRALRFVAERLRGREFLVGDRFTIADAHLTWWLSIADRAQVDLGREPELLGYLARQRERPAFKRAIAQEANAS